MTLPTGWTEVLLGDVLERIEAGRSFGASGQPASEREWGIIKVSAMTYGRFDERQNKTVVGVDAVRPEFEIQPGDLLLSRANTERYVGATVLVGRVRQRLLLSDKSLRLHPGPNVDRAWLNYALASPVCRSYLSAKSSGVKAGMRNISQPQTS